MSSPPGTPRQTEFIPIEKIRVAEENVRKHGADRDVEELASSIKRLGLLQPVVVQRGSVAGDYSLIVGQRRLLAHKFLGEMLIEAFVQEEADHRTALGLSLAENIFRAELTHQDTADAVNQLYDLYAGDIDQICEATGISKQKVNRYLALTKVWPDSPKIADTYNANLLDVKRALDAAHGDIKQAEQIIEHMEGMTGSEKTRLTELVASNPELDLEEAVEESTKPRVETRISLDLTRELEEGLKKASEVLQMEPSEVAAQAIEEWLREQQFIQ